MVQPPCVHLKQLLWYGVPLTETFDEIDISSSSGSLLLITESLI